MKFLIEFYRFRDKLVRISCNILRLLWRFPLRGGLVVIRVTPNAARLTVGGTLPVTIAFRPRPRCGFEVTLHLSDGSVIDAPQRISVRAGCSTVTMMVGAHRIGDAEITVTVSPTARFGPIVERILCRMGAVVGLGIAHIRLTVGRPPIVVFAPHPDDEALMASGIIANALRSEQPVRVVVVTNGEGKKGFEFGLKRQGESVAAMSKLGLPITDLIFLGYPGGGTALIRMMNNYVTPDVAYTSTCGLKATYGACGLGGRDFHSWLTGKAAAYNAPNLQSDLETVLRAWRPTDIYTTSRFDEHPDHRAVYYFVARAVQSVQLERPSYAPTLHTTIIHDVTTEPYDDFWGREEPSPGRAIDFSGDNCWPLPACSTSGPEVVRFDASTCFSEPLNLWRTGLRWSEVESVSVPPSMRVTVREQNLKYQVLATYSSQPVSFLAAFCKQDEIFWTEHLPASELLAFPPVKLNVKKDEATPLGLTLIRPARAPCAIALATSDDAVVVVPPAVIVPTGEVSVVIPVKAMGVGNATVKANLGGERVVANVTVIEDELQV